MNSLEQIRSIFDEGMAGLVRIGIPGIEKRTARSAVLLAHRFLFMSSVHSMQSRSRPCLKVDGHRPE